jgi:glycosyltransferase involved in cell wall biosynthesis
VKVLCINYEYPPLGGGGGVFCQGLAETLVKLGYEIDVVTSGMNHLPSYEEINGVRVHRVKCIRRHQHYVGTLEMATQILPAYYKALELVKNNNYDFNHTHFVVPSGVVSYKLWKKTGLPYIITAHGSDIPGYNPDRFEFVHKLIRFQWKPIINNSEIVATPSNFMKRLILKHAEVPIEIIPYGHDPCIKNKTVKRNRILVVTRIFERKGVQYLLEAIAKLDTNWEIHIAGDGPYLTDLKAMAKKVKPTVKFLGFIRGQELFDLYSSAKIFVFPSIQENFPVVLLEAMAAGCAVITTSAEGCGEVIGNAGIQVESKNVKELRAMLERLMNDEEEIGRLAGLARKRIGNFAWQNIAGKYDSLFRNHILPKRS